MNIYLTHATSFDYQAELYLPIRQSTLNQEAHLVLPHETNTQAKHSQCLIKECDIVIAEVSYPSTGQGIELGWANSHGIPIYCLYQQPRSYSSSLCLISKLFIAYSSPDELINAIQEIIQFSRATLTKAPEMA